MDPVTWGNFPLPLIQVNAPSINLTNEIVNSAYKVGIFSNSGPLQVQASELLSGHVNPTFAGYLACSNTSGLVACLLEMNVRNRHVLVSNFTFAATLNSIVLAGGIPVLCDIASDELVITANNVAEILEIKGLDIAAVVPTRVFGFISDFSEIVDICEKKGIPVLIDAAATFPSRKNVWNFKHQARYEVFSLHATKVFGIGEGGLIVGSPEAINSVRERANFGIGSVDPLHFQDGLNAKADEFAAARALARFSEYTDDVEVRRTFALKYKSLFENSQHIKIFNDGLETIYSYFPVIFDTEENLIKFMEHVSPYIRTRRYYFPSLNHGYNGNSRIEKPVTLEISDSISRRILCLPVYVLCSEEAEKKIMELMDLAEGLLT